MALYLYNCPEYLEATFACFKLGLVPINTNYRYVDEELTYLWDNADTVAVVFHGTFTDRIERIRSRLPRIRTWLWVDDDTAACPDWAAPYEDVASGAGRPRAAGGSGRGADPSTTGRVGAPWGRSPDDLYLLYTGGTTGMPKGVMWRQDDLFARLNGSGFRRYPEDGGPDDVRAELERSGRGMTLLPACPLMHGTGGFTALECLSEGGRVVTLASRQFDPVELLDTVVREQVNGLIIVGDVFAKPILAALDAHPGRWELTSLVGIVSSGVMWSEETKQGLLRHYPGMLLVDAFSSSEALGMGTSVSSGDTSARTARFSLGPEVRVLDADGRDIEPGSGESGVLALGGRIPVGLLQGRGQVVGHLPDHRRRPVLGARRLRRSGCGRLHPPAGPRLGGHQHRGREGLPRGGGGGHQDARRRGRRRGGGHPQRPVRRGDRGRGRARGDRARLGDRPRRSSST